MRHTRRFLALLVVALVALGGVVAMASAQAKAPPGAERVSAPISTQPADGARQVPSARCSEGDLPETGIQGDVPAADQASGRSLQGYRCNLGLVGNYNNNGDGANVMSAYYKDCAYMSTAYAQSDPEFDARKGAVVVDMSNPANPRETARLQTPAMVASWESMKVNQKRGLIAANQGGIGPSTPNNTGMSSSASAFSPGPYFDIYDISKDCRRPILKASVPLPHASGHEGDFAPDGRTYYISTILNAPEPGIIAVDVSNPSRPRELLAWPNPVAGSGSGFHGLSVSPDGKVGYLMVQGGSANGLLIVDLSDIQLRRPNPKIRKISYLHWEDSNTTQMAVQARIGGHPYLFTTDEQGYQNNAYKACAAGQPMFGFVHIIDIADVKHPKMVGNIQLGVSDPANCAEILAEPYPAGFYVGETYASHYCAVDNPVRTTALACTWLGSGLRVFDVRKPKSPTEIAYYNAPPNPTAGRGAAIKVAFFPNPNMDFTASDVAWKRGRDGKMSLWYMSTTNGMTALAFADGVYPFRVPLPRPDTKAVPERMPSHPEQSTPLLEPQIPGGGASSNPAIATGGQPRAASTQPRIATSPASAPRSAYSLGTVYLWLVLLAALPVAGRALRSRTPSR